jgi:hypothetical protein
LCKQASLARTWSYASTHVFFKDPASEVLYVEEEASKTQQIVMRKKKPNKFPSLDIVFISRIETLRSALSEILEDAVLAVALHLLRGRNCRRR